MSRKTFKVEKLKNIINANNAHLNGDENYRLAQCAILEKILFETGNYNGFRYLTQDEVPEGELCGVILSEEDGNQFPDISRRFYF